MSLPRARYFLKETANGLWQFKTRHVFSLTIICLSFLILGIFLSLSNHLGAQSQELAKDLTVVFFLRPNASEADTARVEAALRASPLAGSVRLIEGSEARERFLKNFPELADIVRNLQDNPFSASFEITLPRPDIGSEAVQRWIAEMKTDAAVEDAQFNREWADKIRSLSGLARAIGYFLGGILVLASFLIISNVIKLNVLARRSEIELLRLVGATNMFIRIPFLLEGVVLGVAGGLLSVGLVGLVVRLFPVYLGTSLGAFQELIGFGDLNLLQSAALAAGGGLVGFLGSMSSVARFLRV